MPSFAYIQKECLTLSDPWAVAYQVPPPMEFSKQETWFLSLVWEDFLEKEMATHSSILAWESRWTEEPGELVNGVTKESDTT